MCEMKDFKNFYNKARVYALYFLTKFSSRKDAIFFARKNIAKKELNVFYKIGTLNDYERGILNTPTELIKLSIDSMIKNIIEHSDLTYDDYLKLKEIVHTPDKIIQDRKNNLRMFKNIDNKLYEIVIKTTKNKDENFLTTFHRCDISKIRNKKR